LKDGIYGMIDPQDRLRPAATVFKWGRKYLVGEVMHAQSNNPLLEALVIRRSQREHAILLINKSGSPTSFTLKFVKNPSLPKEYEIFTLDNAGLKQGTLTSAALQKKPILMSPYSLQLLNVAI
jgi:hypothetical protein